MVATVDEEVLRPQPLICVEQEGNLSRPRPSVDEVSVKQVPLLVAWHTIYPEKLHQIEVLPYSGM
jgi:hypothetical protein